MNRVQSGVGEVPVYMSFPCCGPSGCRRETSGCDPAENRPVGMGELNLVWDT